MDAYVMFVAKIGLLSKKYSKVKTNLKGYSHLHIKPDVIIDSFNSSHLTAHRLV